MSLLVHCSENSVRGNERFLIRLFSVSVLTVGLHVLTDHLYDNDPSPLFQKIVVKNQNSAAIDNDTISMKYVQWSIAMNKVGSLTRVYLSYIRNDGRATDQSKESHVYFPFPAIKCSHLVNLMKYIVR